MRLFIAVEISDEAKEKIKEALDALSGMGFRAKFVEPENLHITLKFLGEVSDDKLESLCEDVRKVCEKHSGFSFSLENVGYFGKRNDIRVVWVGVNTGLDNLKGIMNDLRESLNYIRRDEHEGVPHLTIARVRYAHENSGLADEIEKIRNVKFGEVSVKEIVIKKSVLTPKGPVYSDYKSFKLREV